MRFKKGSKVEVFSQKEVPSGSWRCGKILSGNGHNYDVVYDCAPGVASAGSVDRVSRKTVRPRPPPVETFKEWVVGDIVEVYDHGSWKMATVSEVMSGDHYSVRLLGSYWEFETHKSYLRVRQSWKDDDWVVVGKGVGNCTDDQSNKRSTLRIFQNSSNQLPKRDNTVKLHGGDKYFLAEDNACFQDSRRVTSRTLKRGSSYDLPYAEPCVGAALKVRAIEEAGRRRRMVLVETSPLIEKVDDVASPQNMLGEKHMHASFYDQTGLSQTETGRAKPNGDVGSFVVRGLECNDADSSECCSVASCSITSNSPYRFSRRSSTSPRQDLDGHSSDAESCSGPRYEREWPIATKEDLAAELHKLELHAYRCTIGALYASGPLSWEQEELVTNLRLTLHISNDEHLMEGHGWRPVHLASKGQKMMIRYLRPSSRQAVSLSFCAMLKDVQQQACKTFGAD